MNAAASMRIYATPEPPGFSPNDWDDWFNDDQRTTMNSLKHRKAEILARIQENRDKHRAVFEKAMEGYHAEVQKRLEAALSQIKNNKIPDFYAMVQLPVPEDHTGDYDAILDMLHMTIEDEIDMSQNEYRQYVRDEWTWKREFAATSMSYGVHA